MKLEFIRHATTLLYINGKKILVDPMLSPKGTLTAVPGVPNAGPNPLVELPVSAEHLTDCDAVLLTHTHRDHFDERAAEMLPKSCRIFCQPEDEAKMAESGFSDIVAVDKYIEWDGITLCRTKARHGHGMIAKKMAPVSGYILKAPKEPCLYVAGDTIWCSPIAKALDAFKPDIVVSYCGAARFSCGRAITMDSRDILSMCLYSPSLTVVAVHMEAWNHCRLTRKALSDYAVKHGINSRVLIPADGEALDF